MASAWSEAIGSVTGSFGGSLWTIGLIIVALGVAFLLLAVAAWWWFIKKKWNLKAEIKLVRSDGRLINAEWGKAAYNAKRGVVLLKRPDMWSRPIPIKPFDVRKYIQGDNIVTFVQLGPEDYRPVLNDTWEEYIDDKPMKDNKGNLIRDEKGKLVYARAAMINLKVDKGLNKAWKAAWSSAAKQAYSLKSFFTQFQTPIAIAIVIIAVFVGFAMVWTRLGSICG